MITKWQLILHELMCVKMLYTAWTIKLHCTWFICFQKYILSPHPISDMNHTHSHTHITAHPHRWFLLCCGSRARFSGSILTGECCVVVMAWAALMDTWRAGVMLSLETMSYNRHPSISKRPPVAMVTSRSRRRELQLVRTWKRGLIEFW